MKIQKILFPTDLSFHAEPAKSYAGTLARRHGAQLLLLHAVLTHEHDFRPLGTPLDDFLDNVEKESEKSLRRECDELEKEGLVVSFAVERKATAYEAIVETIESWKPDLVVMGTHGRAGVARWLIGSVAEKVVRHARVPVVTVRPDASLSAEVGRILVPVDFSENSRRAVDAATDMKGARSTLVLLHVVLNPAFSGLYPGDYIQLFGVDPELPERVRTRMKEWMESEPFDAEVREAEDVAECILDTAKERSCDLIVIGTRGLTGLDHLLMGSVAEKVVRFSPVPVLSVK